MTKLKLGPLRDDKPVEVRLELPIPLHRDLVAQIIRFPTLCVSVPSLGSNEDYVGRIPSAREASLLWT